MRYLTKVPMRPANELESYTENLNYHHMTRDEAREMAFWDYFCWWTKKYKVGHIRPVTIRKYYSNAKSIWIVAPNAKLKDFEKNRHTLQALLDGYGQTHQHATTLEFKNHVIASLRSATDDQFIDGISISQIKVHTVEDTWSQQKKSEVKNEVKTLDATEYRKFKLQIEIELQEKLKEPAIIPPTDPSRFVRRKGNTSISEQTKLMVLMILLHTGCRFAEAIGVTFEDVSNGELKIDKTWDYKDNTGFAKTKNTSSIRTVYIDATLEKMINDFHIWKLKNFGESKLPIGVEPDTYFYNDTMNSYFRRKQKQYGINKNLSIHKIRHTYISYLLNEGVSAETIARQVGHSDTTMIQQVYGHLMAERQAQDKLKISSLMS